MVRSLFCLALMLVMSGCGGPTGPQRASVSGEVLVDGQPLSEGAISFIPADGVKGPTSGTKVINGRYQVEVKDGPVLGAHRIELTAFRMADGSPLKKPESSGADQGESAMSTGGEIVQFIPAEYNSKSTLTLDVQSGENPFNINVKLKK